MNTSLHSLIKQGQIGFDDILAAYAEMCIQQVRDITEDMVIDDPSVDLSTEHLTRQAVDWALTIAPEMLADVTDEEKRDNESFLEFIIRNAVEQQVKNTHALRVKLS